MVKLDTDKATTLLGVVAASSVAANSFGVQPELTGLIQAIAVFGISFYTNKK